MGYSKKIKIKLSTKIINEEYIIYEEKIFSDEGYIPDFDFINKFMKNVEKLESTRPIADCLDISNKSESDLYFNLEDAILKEFYLHKIFNISMGNGIYDVTTTSYIPRYNYVSRDSNGNGFVDFVYEIEGKYPFPAGAMSLALEGSFLGSCFIQHKMLVYYKKNTNVYIFKTIYIYPNKK